MTDILKEASDLRYGITFPKVEADASELLKSLQDYRARLDRLEFLMTSVVLDRGKAFRRNKEAQDTLNDKWDKILMDQKDKKMASLVTANEFQAPKEKYASVNLAVFEEKRKARILEEELSWADTTLDIMQKMYRGLDSARQDLLTRIKTIPLVSSLEYTTS